MRFRQLDRITEIQPGNSLAAVRTLSDREGYFQDHFPQFAVMPGVLMLEAMFQASMWLVRATDDFAHSVVLLKEVRNVKFSGLVRPGQTLTVTASLKKLEPDLASLAAEVAVEGTTVASGRLVLERFNLADRYPVRAPTDESLRTKMRAACQALQGPEPLPAAPTVFRWMWLDRFLEFVEGRRAVALKNVTMSDEPIDLYQPGFPVLPCSLILEGIAQTGGILVGACHDFRKRIVLAKIGKAVFHRPAVPGDGLIYTTEILGMQSEGALIRATSRIGDEPHAEVECSFGFLDDRFIGAELITAADVLTMLRVYGLFEVAKTADGGPTDLASRMMAPG